MQRKPNEDKGKSVAKEALKLNVAAQTGIINWRKVLFNNCFFPKRPEIFVLERPTEHLTCSDVDILL
jgi:hypothetical protein